jgi:ACS family hexuronate transporter-like MFS transporter
METIGKYRWKICALLFFATTINYLDRQVIGLLKPVLEKEFDWTETDYSNIVIAFQAAYAISLLGFGGIIDRIGTKLGYSISIVVWSIAAMMHALATGTMSFAFMRGLLGLGEAGNFPAAIKTVAEWFPKNERALATGIFNSGANIGAVAAPILVPWILGAYGWEMAFIATGAIGFIWLIFWWLYYEVPSKHKSLSKAEFDYIHADMEAKDDNVTPVRWAKLFGFKQTWAFFFGKMFTDPIWWFFLFWLPSYFSERFQLDLKKPSLELIIVYTATTIGSIGGGWLSGYLINKGWPSFKARKWSMFSFAIAVVPIMLARYCDNIWQAVGLISLAAAAHQAWSANIYSIATDMFPKKAVSSVIGIGGMAGSVGGIFFPMIVGALLDKYKLLGDINDGYNIIFLLCGSAYMLAWVIIYTLVPTLETAKIDD